MTDGGYLVIKKTYRGFFVMALYPYEYCHDKPKVELLTRACQTIMLSIHEIYNEMTER